MLVRGAAQAVRLAGRLSNTWPVAYAGTWRDVKPPSPVANTTACRVVRMMVETDNTLTEGCGRGVCSRNDNDNECCVCFWPAAVISHTKHTQVPTQHLDTESVVEC